MKNNQPVTQQEFDYPEDWVIISATDTKGRITHVNEDFLKTSGFEEEELVGRPHNVIRHPDMPPAAFQDMWDQLQAGQPWMGIVKNRCKNGDHYWVDAYVTPLLDGDEIVGYESVRTKPDPEHVRRAEQRGQSRRLEGEGAVGRKRGEKARPDHQPSLGTESGGEMSLVEDDAEGETPQHVRRERSPGEGPG